MSGARRWAVPFTLTQLELHNNSLCLRYRRCQLLFPPSLLNVDWPIQALLALALSLIDHQTCHAAPADTFARLPHIGTAGV